jgi:two-component sensor histidine kinase
LKDNKLEHYSKNVGLEENNFFAIRSYKDHLIVATLNGIYIVNTMDNSSRYITESDGLNSELVYSIEITNKGKDLWVGTNQGINKIDLQKYFHEGKAQIISYGKQQGFMGVECNSNGIWEDKDGSLWFGTVSGLILHEPFHLKANKVPNVTLIQNIKLFSEDTLLKPGSELPSKYNSISFYYKGVCLTNPEQVRYVRKLDGLEKEWSSVSTEDYCKYTNLAPGSYTFLVKSCNSEGVWDEQPTAFPFTVLRPFYATWWFVLLVSGGTSAMVLLVVNYRINSIKRKQKEEFDRKVEMSKIELKALRAQMNPHFIFNSLNSIQHYIFNSKSDEAIKYLSKFARLVRTILNNSNKPTVTVGEDLEALRLYLELEQMRFEEKFDYEITVDPSVDADYDIMPPLLIQPYVENAILHGLNPKPGRGKLTISFRSDSSSLICTITDNGIGREKASEIKRTMPVSKHKSMGMKITEDRLRILNEVNNSNLSVNVTDLKDEKGEAAGTKVELYIPILG